MTPTLTRPLEADYQPSFDEITACPCCNGTCAEWRPCDLCYYLVPTTEENHRTFTPWWGARPLIGEPFDNWHDEINACPCCSGDNPNHCDLRTAQADRERCPHCNRQGVTNHATPYAGPLHTWDETEQTCDECGGTGRTETP